MQLNLDRIRFIDSLSFFQMPLSAFQKPLVWTSSRKAISRNISIDLKIKTTKVLFQINTIICQRWCQPAVAKRLKRGTPSRRVHSILLKSWWRIANLMSSYWKKAAWSSNNCLKKKPSSILSAVWPSPPPVTTTCVKIKWKLNRFRTARMVTLGRFKAPQDSACEKRGRIQNSQLQLHGGWVRRSHHHCLRISRMFLSRMSQILPNRSESHCRLEDRSMEDVYINTTRKIIDLESRGYKVKQTWECQWAELKQSDPVVWDFVNKLEIVAPLNPRCAFCSGRTNAIKLYRQTEADETVDYYDFTSLYPYVNKNKLYPLGHPKIFFEPGHTDIFQYFGIAKCTVLPPYELYHPVLPLRHNDKLTFPLCCTCVETEMEKPMLERSYVSTHWRTKTDYGNLVHTQIGRSCETKIQNNSYSWGLAFPLKKKTKSRLV